jgi:hypothetical protein
VLRDGVARTPWNCKAGSRSAMIAVGVRDKAKLSFWAGAALLLAVNSYVLERLLQHAPAPSPPPAATVAAHAPAKRGDEEESVVAELSSAQKAPAAATHDGSRKHALADLAVLISIDGLRPDVIFPNALSIHRLILEGAFAPVARTASKSATLPSHASMVSGVDVDRHGLGFNAYRPERGNIQYPTIFTAAKKAGLTTALFVGKRKLEHLLDPNSQVRFEVGGVRCSRVTKLALPYLRTAEPGVVFLHFDDTDNAGHQFGWMSEEYLAGVKRADYCVKQVLDALRTRPGMDRTLLVVTADHGGHGHDHAAPIPPDTHIPWVAWGGAAAKTTRVRRTVSTTDTAATILYALDLPMPPDIEGKPVLEALRR